MNKPSMHKGLTSFRHLSYRAVLTLLVVALLQAPAVQAGGNDSLQRDTDQLVRSVQTALTLQGKWPPPVGSQEMQLCTALQAFSQDVKRAPRSSNNNQYQSGQFGDPQFASLQASAASVDSFIGLASNSPDVPSRWMNIKNEIGFFSGNPYGSPYGSPYSNHYGNPNANPYGNSYHQGLVNQAGIHSGFHHGFNPAFNPGFNGNTGFNGSNFGTNSFGSSSSGFNNPGFNNNFGNQFANTSLNVSGRVSDLNNAMRDFSSFSQKSLGSGGFNAGNPSAIFAMANALQQLQSTVKSAGNSLARSNSYGQQQMQVQLMATAFNNFETQFNQAGPNAAVQMRYGQLKQQFSILQHSVLMNSGRMR
ncbi:MAG: hypothetical protein Q8T09_23070 [Candidatus Melainabacteria bacterium]|nr:hypothetical protein [Candidatus Melainabacteria bacterium]